MRHKHTTEQDHICPVCKMNIRAHIPHECDPSICKGCNGTGQEWIGRVEGVFLGQRVCTRCGGTGKVSFTTL